MIIRKYFVSCKVSHNNNTGKYSYWNSIITTNGIFEDRDKLLKSVRLEALDELIHQLDRGINEQDVEVLALNRI